MRKVALKMLKFFAEKYIGEKRKLTAMWRLFFRRHKIPNGVQRI
jgi:hypothetical protein